MLLDRAFDGSASRICQSEQPTCGTQRYIAVKLRLCVNANEIFVGGFTDAKIKGVESTLAACLHQPENQALSRAFDCETSLNDRIKHGAEPAAANDATHGGHNDVINGECVEFDQRIAIDEVFRRRCFDKASHTRQRKGIRHAGGTHASALLLEESIEDTSHVVGPCHPLKTHFAETRQRSLFLAHLFASVAACP